MGQSNNRYINREISWLKFNSRVLQEAMDKKNPLLERLRFLGIYSNNLDEFYKVRYAYIARMIQFNRKYNNIVEEQEDVNLLEEINMTVAHQQEKYDKLYEQIIKELAKEKTLLVDDKTLPESLKPFVQNFFENKLSHNLTILYWKQGDKTINLRDNVFYLIVTMTKKNGNKQYALIEVPSDRFSRFLVLPDINDKHYVIFLEDIIRYHLRDIFQFFKFETIEGKSIKLTKDADLSIDNDVQVSYVDSIAGALKERLKGLPVRLVYDKTIDSKTLQFLKKMFDLDEYDSLAPGGKYHNKKDFMKFPTLGRQDLEYKKIDPIIPKILKGEKNYFKAFAKEDTLLYTPYYDYSVFLKFLRGAAIDPKVKKIKITIYRVAGDSQVLSAILNAARNGKEVTAVLELRARFDEAHNIKWSKQLQDEGVKVIFGVPGLKVHSKIGIVEREPQRGAATKYAFISTGNFHEGTARLYTDFTLFTANEAIVKQVDQVFDFFNTNYLVKHYKDIAVSPWGIRRKLMLGIEREIKNKKNGLPAQINIKVNSICDKEIIDYLYEASKVGVEVRMVVRGICSIIPQVPGLSENIKIISVVDKFLEHPRIYWFKNGGDDLIYISSADIMARNLDYRVEVACPVTSIKNKHEIMKIFELGFNDNVKGRLIKEGFEEPYQKNRKKKNRSQESIYQYIKELNK
ncbi:polyphosphate kinase [Apibacter mensalis]|uniref:Polyphosphate kinase n=1 Tax=Apibacter mensalis TaxID=1586267 RepID=A0A0X3AMS7_9FLAO|nr:polyphosphate kinase 1 [Apibacter mensalis]CVK15533.1 polyphosphate kinase [Apibacter mensalis]